MMSEQLAEAGMLMGVGMTVVFAFLTLLIAGIHSIAWLAKLLPEAEQKEHTKTKANYSKKNLITVDSNIKAAISAAVNAHRRSGK